MEHDREEAGLCLPAGWRRHEEPEYGYAIQVPRRFIVLSNTVDPVAVSMRSSEDDDKAVRDAERWPRGFCDPAILTQFGDGRLQPGRFLEFDVMHRTEPMPEEQAGMMWFGIREQMPMALEQNDLPGYRLLDVGTCRLGRLDALAFTYRWDGLNPGDQGGDKCVVVWSLTPMRLFHVYYHCLADCWDEWEPERRQILASFELWGEEEWTGWEAL